VKVVEGGAETVGMPGNMDIQIRKMKCNAMEKRSKLK